MSRNGQTPLRRPRVDLSLPSPVDHNCPRAIVAGARDFDAALETPPHSHPRGQLIYAERGTLTTTAATGTWVAPANRAIWISAGVTYVTRLTVNTEIRSIFIRKDANLDLPLHCAVVQVDPLLRELILAVVRLPALYDEDGADGRLVGVLLDRVAVLPQEPLHLPTPTSANLRAIATDLPGILTCRSQKQRAMPLAPALLCSAFFGSDGVISVLGKGRRAYCARWSFSAPESAWAMWPSALATKAPAPSSPCSTTHSEHARRISNAPRENYSARNATGLMLTLSVTKASRAFCFVLILLKKAGQ